MFNGWDLPWPCWWILHPGTRLCRRRRLGRSWCAWSHSIYPLGCQSAPAGSLPLASWHQQGWPDAALSADHRNIYKDRRANLSDCVDIDLKNDRWLFLDIPEQCPIQCWIMTRSNWAKCCGESAHDGCVFSSKHTSSLSWLCAHFWEMCASANKGPHCLAAPVAQNSNHVLQYTLKHNPGKPAVMGVMIN